MDHLARTPALAQLVQVGAQLSTLTLTPPWVTCWPRTPSWTTSLARRRWRSSTHSLALTLRSGRVQLWVARVVAGWSDASPRVAEAAWLAGALHPLEP